MKDRIHSLQTEIKNIESVLDTLNDTMFYHATEELKNLRFEMEMLKRNVQKTNGLQPELQVRQALEV
jgi:hypothetical protein